VSTDYVPSREDRFSFGIWTVGWQGVDVFGSAVRPPMPAERAVYKLAELGAYGVNFHDNDVFAFDATEAGRDERIGAFRKVSARRPTSSGAGAKARNPAPPRTSGPRWTGTPRP
jgi:hypothetical protein